MVDMDWIASTCLEGALKHSATAWSRPRRLLVSLDAFAAAIAFGFAALIFGSRLATRPDSGLANLLFQAFLSIVVLALLYRDGQYSPDRRMSRFSDLGSIIKGAALAFFFVAGVWLTTDGFFTGDRAQSRLLVFCNLLFFVGLLVANRFALTSYQRRLFGRGEGTRNVIVVGQGNAAGEFLSFLEKRPWLGLHCSGTMPVRGEGFSVPRIRKMLESGEASDLVVALEPGEREDFERISAALNQAGLCFRVVPSLFEESLRASRVHGFRGLSVFNVDVDPLNNVQRTMKRLLDISFAGAALLVLSPLLLLIALAIKLESKGPVVFHQVRLGIGGRPFEILKFRTMVIDAEARLESLKDKNEVKGPMFKIKRDPRITRVGGILRKLSLDELPQFFNVLIGEMSLVGPRPPLPREVDEYDTSHLIRLKGKPGITGLWQVSGRSDLSFEEMVTLDRHYVENWSIRMDLNIIVRTVAVVLGSSGAY
jgi:exopolysaccharide biosynthesis polyprenyl glycosylphosphotransferase